MENRVWDVNRIGKRGKNAVQGYEKNKKPTPKNNNILDQTRLILQNKEALCYVLQ